jgi:universal stress protein E
MSQYKTIFLIASPSMVCSPAFIYATNLAKATGARLHICIFDYSETIAAVRLVAKDLVEVAKKAYIEVRRDWARTEASGLLEQGIHATGDAVWAHPMAQEMLTQISELKPDLVIKDSRHESMLKQVFLTPVDWQLLRLCPAPLLLVNSAANTFPKRIIAALDPLRDEPEDSDFNKKIVHEALGLAIQCNAELHLATAFNPTPRTGLGTAESGVLLTAELFETLRANHIDHFMAVADENGVPLDRRHFVEGPAAVAISELAGSSAADVVVVGATQRRGLERLLMGSTAESIFEYAPCNVLAIKPEGFQRHFDEYMHGAR